MRTHLTLAITLAIVGAAFAVTDDAEARARFDEHRCRDAPCMRAFFKGVAVLRTDDDATPRGGRNQRERRADRDIDVTTVRCQRDGIDFGERGKAAVHLPVSGDKLACRHAPALWGRDVLLKAGLLPL